MRPIETENMFWTNIFHIDLVWPLPLTLKPKTGFVLNLHLQALCGWSKSKTGPIGQKICSGEGFQTEMFSDLYLVRSRKVTEHPIPCIQKQSVGKFISQEKRNLI